MKKLYWSLAVLLIVIASFFLVFKAQIPAPSSDALAENQATNQVIKEGLSITMAIKPVTNDKKPTNTLLEGQSAHLQFTIENVANKQPVKGLHPAVWLERENSQEKTLSCKDRINSYLQGKIGFRPEISLNSYFVLAMNNNSSISVIDPLNGFGGSKLMARIKLNSPATDWVLNKDHKILYVLTPLIRQVALVDTQTWKVTKAITFDTTPTRLALQPDDKYLWVGLDNKDEKTLASVAVIDTEQFTITKSLTTGAGHHEFTFSDDSRTAYVSNKNDSSVAVIDIEQLSIKQTVTTSAPIVALAFSTLSKSAYAAVEDGKILVLNATANTEITTDSPLKTIRISADGRWGFALSQTANKLFIFDVSVNRLVHSLNVGDAPDQISLTDHFAYIHSINSEIVNMIQLDTLGKEAGPSVTSFPGGQSASGQVLTDAIAPTPERNAVVVANPNDKTVYYYTEGMAAPMGNFENQGLKPMAVMIANRSMRETAPGIYTGSTQLPPAGHYNVAVLLDNPTVYHCFSTDIAANPDLIKQSGKPVKVEYLLDNKDVSVGTSLAVKIKLTHPDQKRIEDSVKDLEVIFFRIPGQWQQRMTAKAQGNSIYQVDVTPSEAGFYQIFVQSPSLGLIFNEQTPFTFRAVKSQTKATGQ